MNLTSSAAIPAVPATPAIAAYQLDQTYTALAEASARVGEARLPLFLATLALALLSRQDNGVEALTLIAQAERLAAT